MLNKIAVCILLLCLALVYIVFIRLTQLCVFYSNERVCDCDAHLAESIFQTHGLLLLYFPFYLAAFAYLEKKVPDKVHIINCAIDQYIPFVEVFIIPYLLWFAYVAVAGIYFFFKEKESFCKWMYFGMIGMTIFIIVSYLYPNGLELRPETFTRDNIFVQLTKMIYSMDTPTNVLPSIHVFNSMAVYFAVKNSPKLKEQEPLL